MLAQLLSDLPRHRPALLLILAARCPDWIALAQGLTAGNACAILACEEASMLLPDQTQPAYALSDPWWDLAAAVLLQAVKDAQSGSERNRQAARHWLTGQAGVGFCHLFNLEPEALYRRLCYTETDAPLGAEGD